MGITQGASWDALLVTAINRVIAAEARAWGGILHHPRPPLQYTYATSDKVLPTPFSRYSQPSFKVL